MAGRVSDDGLKVRRGGGGEPADPAQRRVRSLHAGRGQFGTPGFTLGLARLIDSPLTFGAEHGTVLYGDGRSVPRSTVAELGDAFLPSGEPPGGLRLCLGFPTLLLPERGAHPAYSRKARFSGTTTFTFPFNLVCEGSHVSDSLFLLCLALYTFYFSGLIYRHFDSTHIAYSGATHRAKLPFDR